jgi:hypothetical protein
MPSIEKRIIGKIRAKGRGWAFSHKDFATYAVRSTVGWVLYNLHEKGTIRRVSRGIFDYPRFSKKLNRELPPDIDQVARALARKSNLSIEPSGQAALNILGLSTQVPAKYLYRWNGPNQTYKIDRTELIFRKTRTKDIGFQHYESSLIVQALRSLGKERVDEKTISHIRGWLDPKLRSRVLKDTASVTSWIHDSIRQICIEDQDG